MSDRSIRALHVDARSDPETRARGQETNLTDGRGVDFTTPRDEEGAAGAPPYALPPSPHRCYSSSGMRPEAMNDSRMRALRAASASPFSSAASRRIVARS